ncbi:MAG: ferritin-like domain-containing protein [Actinomycetia bacterium]|nr:ferritin-like domain-containing protein [Actinomycetes bacterium]
MNAAVGLDDPAYRAAAVDLLGVLAYGELSAFHRLASDAALAPTISDQAALAAMAVAEFRHFVRLRDRLADLGVDPEGAMRPFVASIDGFHESTAPSDWLEGLMKAYVGDGVGADFYREVARVLDPETQALVLDVMADTGHSAFVVATIRDAIAEDPRVAGRLALWGRRLVGEMLSQAQRVAAERDGLSALLVGDVAGGGALPGFDLAEIGRMLARLTEAHTRRMQALGLSA